MTTAVVLTLGATVGSGLLNYGYGLALAFMLPSREYALYGGASALLLVTGTMANASVPWALAQALARIAHLPRSERRPAIAAASRLNLLAGAAVAVAVVPIAAWIGTRDLAIVVGLATFAYFVASTPMGYAQGVGRFRLLGFLILGEVAIKVVLGLPAVAFDGRVVFAIGAAAAGALVIAGVGAVAMGHDFVLWGGRQPIAGLARVANGMAGVQALVAALTSLCIVIALHRYGAGAATARLQIALTLGQIPIYLALAISLAAFAELTRAGASARVRMHGLRQYVIVALPVTAMLVSLPDSFLDAFLPDRFDGANTLLPWTALTGLAYGIVTLQATWLKAIRAFRTTFVALALALAGGAGIAWLGASLWGIRGLAAGAFAASILASAALARIGARVPLRALSLQHPRASVALTLLFAGLLVCQDRPELWIALAAALTVLAARLALQPQLPVSAER